MICAGAVILALPMLVYGPYPAAHDVYEHITYCRYFSGQFWAGEWYPRWLMNINHGLGSPTFFVFPPFPAYVYTLLEPLTNALRLDTFVAGEFLALVVSGLSAFLWLQTIAEQRIAVAGAVLYMLAPYHLAIDFYLRTALPECWALAWLPLLLYFGSRIMERRRGAAVAFAVVYALLIISHLISVLIFSPVPLAMALFLAPMGRRLNAFWGIVKGVLLGTALSSVYLIPALWHAKNFPPLAQAPPLNVVGLFLIGSRSLLSRGFFFFAAIFGADAMLLCVLFGAAVFAKGNLNSKKTVGFWLAMSVVPAFMLCGLSLPVWRRFPVLLKAVQYPFRLNVILCVAEIAILAIALSRTMWVTDFQRRIRLVLVLLLIVPWTGSYLLIWEHYKLVIWEHYKFDSNPRAELAKNLEHEFDDDGWFDSWKAAGLDDASALRASSGPRVRFTEGTGTAEVLAWTPRHIEFETSSATGGQVMVNQFYYPFWQAAWVSSATRVATKAAMPEGLIEVSVPAGQAKIRLDINTGLDEYAGRWISAISVLLCAFLVWKARRGERTLGICRLDGKSS